MNHDGKFPRIRGGGAIQTQEAFRIPNGVGKEETKKKKIKEKRTSLDHVVIKTLNIQNKV